jgi:N6-adenosine-specific RNA methylase IME4
MADCVLYQNDEASVTLLDIPRSIESAQGLPGHLCQRKLKSSEPLRLPYHSAEPKIKKARSLAGSLSIEDLLLQRHLELALQDIAEFHDGDWCLPRAVFLDGSVEYTKKKRPKVSCSSSVGASGETRLKRSRYVQEDELDDALAISIRDQSPQRAVTEPAVVIPQYHIPPTSRYVQDEIEPSILQLCDLAPSFDCILMDPPWPNRSARRKQSYATSYGTAEIEALLSCIPIQSKLNDSGLVGVWVTNKPAFRDMLLGTGGFFDKWNLELVEEWIWVKVTANGEPITPLNGVWRKPYEILLLGRQCSQVPEIKPPVKRRVIVAVPDLHSRKPSLKTLLEALLPSHYNALEVFARNLTSGWWAWGNEVLKFQHVEHWVDE